MLQVLSPLPIQKRNQLVLDLGWLREPALHHLVLGLLMMGFRAFGCAKWLGTFAGHPEHLAAARAFPVGQMHAIPNGR